MTRLLSESSSPTPLTSGPPALTGSPPARAYPDFIRARGAGHHAALRQLANGLVGIPHGCLKSRALNEENSVWPLLDASAA